MHVCAYIIVSKIQWNFFTEGLRSEYEFTFGQEYFP